MTSVDLCFELIYLITVKVNSLRDSKLHNFVHHIKVNYILTELHVLTKENPVRSLYVP